MSTFTNAMRTNDTYTANGALTNSTSLNACLDLFSLVGNHKDFSAEFWKAYAEDPRLAMKILFWSRDCREGSGARATFASVMRDLQVRQPNVFSKVFRFIPEFGYWKDIYKNLRPSQEILELINETLTNDNDHSLCAKYFPRKGLWFAAMKNYLGCTPKELRQLVVKKTQVVENYMCENNWSDINFASVPSVAGLRYKKAFRKHDGERYDEYIQSVLKGEQKINSTVLYPHNIYESYINNRLSYADNEALKAMWNGLPNLMEGCTERILPLCDVSGSMYGTPMNISVALGCYISERNEGVFKNAFMTFESAPQFHYLQGDIIQRFHQLEHANWGNDTNLQAAFEMILTQAKLNKVPQNEMPTKILIISDMHFNAATDNAQYNQRFRRCVDNSMTNHQAIKQKYAAAGYELPGIIFWNVNGDAGNVPVTMNDLNVGLVSGYSPNILKSVLKGEVLTPMQLMLNTVMCDRYACIEV